MSDRVPPHEQADLRGAVSRMHADPYKRSRWLASQYIARNRPETVKRQRKAQRAAWKDPAKAEANARRIAALTSPEINAKAKAVQRERYLQARGGIEIPPEWRFEFKTLRSMRDETGAHIGARRAALMVRELIAKGVQPRTGPAKPKTKGITRVTGAAHFGVSEGTFWKWTKQEGFPEPMKKQTGRSPILRWRLHEVQAWLDGRKR